MADAARFNTSAGVSGVTLYDGRRFLAYMEGPPDGLDVAFSRAAGASSHGELIELARGRVGLRRLPYWPMGCIALGMLVALVEPFAEAAQAALRLHRMAHTRRHRSLWTLGVERVIRLWIEERQ